MIKRIKNKMAKLEAEYENTNENAVLKRGRIMAQFEKLEARLPERTVVEKLGDKEVENA